MATKLTPVHPGAILREEFIEGLGVPPYEVAEAIHVPLPHLNDIVLEKRCISPEMALAAVCVLWHEPNSIALYMIVTTLREILREKDCAASLRATRLNLKSRRRKVTGLFSLAGSRARSAAHPEPPFKRSLSMRVSTGTVSS